MFYVKQTGPNQYSVSINGGASSLGIFAVHGSDIVFVQEHRISKKEQPFFLDEHFLFPRMEDKGGLLRDCMPTLVSQLPKGILNHHLGTISYNLNGMFYYKLMQRYPGYGFVNNFEDKEELLIYGTRPSSEHFRGRKLLGKVYLNDIAEIQKIIANHKEICEVFEVKESQKNEFLAKEILEYYLRSKK